MKKYLFFILSGIFVSFPQHAGAQIIITYSGNGTLGFSGDGGAATAAQLNNPYGVAVDASGNVYIAEWTNNRIRKVNALGTITTIAGNGIPSFYGDGGPATAAELNGPLGIALDGSGNMYIADAINGRIRKIDAAGIITTVAGNGTIGTSGCTGDGGPATAAELGEPFGVAADGAGNVYITAGCGCVRKVNSTGIISTFAGNHTSGYSGDGGPATAAALYSPYGIAADGFGNVYISDNDNQNIRKVNAAGIITTIAGNGTAGFSGDDSIATAAELSSPYGVAVDDSGNVYVGDQYNNRIRRINTLGIISTFAGGGISGLGDGGFAAAAELNTPSGVAVSSSGDVYIADPGWNRVRKVYANDAPSFVAGAEQNLVICENTFAIINSLMSISDADIGQTETWTTSLLPAHGTLSGFSTTATSTGGIVTPTGLSYTPVIGYIGTDSFTIKISDGEAAARTTIHVTVNPSPSAGFITGPSMLCAGVPLSLGDTATGGAWSSSNIAATVSPAGIVTGLSYGIDTISYTVTYGACSNTAAKIITVYPATASILGSSFACIGQTSVLTGIPPGGIWSSSNGFADISSGYITGVSAGVDFISYMASDICGTSVATKPITVEPLMLTSLSIAASPGTLISAGQSDTLTATVESIAPGFTYQWFINGMPVPGATNHIFIGNTFSDNDSVTCLITNNEACFVSTFEWVYITVGATGIGQVGQNDDGLKLIPNPNNGAFIIESALSLNNTAATLEITNVIGLAVYKEIVPVLNGILKRRVNLDKGLANGLYLLHIISNDENKVARFVINNQY